MLNRSTVSSSYRQIFREDPSDSALDFFADSFTTLDLSVDAMVEQAADTRYMTSFYQVFFNRLPDDAGLDFWTGVVRSDPAQFGDTPEGNAALAELFFDSGEFTSIYGGLQTAEIVEGLYRNVLGREPDVPGLEFWISVVDDPTNGFDLIGLGREFSTSPETDTTFRPLIDNYLSKLGNGEFTPGTNIFDFAENPGDTIDLLPFVESATGTANDDVFNGEFGTTYNLDDRINGGDGEDTLNLSIPTDITGTISLAGANVETFNITTAFDEALDFSGNPNAEEVWATNSASNLEFTGIADG